MVSETEVGKFTFSLRVSHPTLTADDIEVRVGQVARHKINAGDMRTRKDGSPLPNSSPVKDSLCCFEDVEGPGATLGDALLTAARRIEARGEAFTDLIAEGCDADFYVGYFLGRSDNDFSIEPELSALLAKLSIRLSICPYDHIE